MTVMLQDRVLLDITKMAEALQGIEKNLEYINTNILRHHEWQAQMAEQAVKAAAQLDDITKAHKEGDWY